MCAPQAATKLKGATSAPHAQNRARALIPGPQTSAPDDNNLLLLTSHKHNGPTIATTPSVATTNTQTATGTPTTPTTTTTVTRTHEIARLKTAPKQLSHCNCLSNQRSPRVASWPQQQQQQQRRQQQHRRRRRLRRRQQQQHRQPLLQHLSMCERQWGRPHLRGATLRIGAPSNSRASAYNQPGRMRVAPSKWPRAWANTSCDCRLPVALIPRRVGLCRRSSQQPAADSRRPAQQAPVKHLNLRVRLSVVCVKIIKFVCKRASKSPRAVRLAPSGRLAASSAARVGVRVLESARGRLILARRSPQRGPTCEPSGPTIRGAPSSRLYARQCIHSLRYLANDTYVHNNCLSADPPTTTQVSRARK